MNFFEAIISGFRNYVGVSGRAVRSQYWYWDLFVVIVLVPLGIIDETLYPGAQMGLFSYVNMIVVAALILPSIAIGVRRLHDIDQTGWWALLALTVVGAVVLLVLACQRGTQGPNRFGPDPMPALGMGAVR